MPYIIFPKLKNLKFLVDTGATKSFIDPDVAKNLFPETIRQDPFIVSNTFSKSAHKYSGWMKTPEIFNRPNDYMKFYLFKFHNIFKGLIGLDNLEYLGATLDFKNKLLITPEAKLRIFYQEIPQKQINSHMIHPRSEQIIKIKTNVKNGDVIIPYINSNGCEIPECVTTSKNYEAFVVVTNKNENEVELSLSDPIDAELLIDKLIAPEKFNYQDNNNSNFHNFECRSADIPKIRTDHMNDEEKKAISKLIREYADIFHNENQQLTFSNTIKHQIRTTDEIPIYTKSYRYPYVHREEVQSQIKKMLDQNIIRESQSPWNAPIWIVPKKQDASGRKKWRVVVDFRKLNEKTIDDRYPLPNINDILDKLGRCQYFTTLDLASGFHQIEMHPSDIQKTAFSVENGHYEFLRMPFGLKNACASFQRVMDNILRGIQNERCLVYLDDIIIFSVSLQEHITNLRHVFQRLRESNFKLQLDKSEFLRKEVNYLGHVITPEGIKPNPDKISAIIKFPIPKTSKQLKGFLGLLGYYRKFIKNFAKITKPLTKCLKKNENIIHNEEFVNCFNMCKNLLTNDPILQYPDFQKTFNLTTDASNVAIGAVLSQGPIGKDLPIAYYSRTLSDSEQNYSTIEKELLGIVSAVKYFRPYLFGKKFNIITDHKPLQYLFSLKEPNSKLVRWRLKLEEYDYNIYYKKGKLNSNADALSRIELNVNESNIFEYMEEFNKNYSKQNLDSVSMIANRDEISDVESLSEVNVNENNTEDQTQHSNREENPIVEIPISDVIFNKGQNQILIKLVNHSPANPKLVRPFPNKQRFIWQISKDNMENDIVKAIKEYVVPKVLYYLYFEPEDIYYQFCEIVRKTFKWPQYKFICTKRKLIDVAPDDILDTVQKYHEGKTNHRGINETEQRIKNLYYWPNMRGSIQKYINECDICQRTKYERNPLNLGINLTPTPAKPFEVVHIDTITIQKEQFLTIIDSFSKYAQIYKLHSLNSIDIIDNLLKFFSYLGIPKKIICDNGTEFKNNNLKEMLAMHKIDLHFITPENPCSNGLIERFHSTLLEHLRLLSEQFPDDDLKMKTLYAILAYNNTIHSATGRTPINIISGHLELDDPFDIDCHKILISNYCQNHKEKTKILYQEINRVLQEQKEKVVSRFNKDKDAITVEPRQEIYPKEVRRITKTVNKFRPKIAVETVDPNTQTIETSKRRYHLRNIKRPHRTDTEKLLQVRPDNNDPQPGTSGNNKST